jgi:hypothetical protein
MVGDHVGGCRLHPLALWPHGVTTKETKWLGSASAVKGIVKMSLRVTRLLARCSLYIVGRHTQFLCQNQVLIVCMTQD